MLFVLNLGLVFVEFQLNDTWELFISESGLITFPPLVGLFAQVGTTTHTMLIRLHAMTANNLKNFY